MNATTQVERGWCESSESPGDTHPTRLAEFTLAFDVPSSSRPIDTLAENPFCRLAARTPEGAAVCDHGCGIAHHGGAPENVCPFGLAMHRVASTAHPARERWIGRRFPTIDAMHAALDRLLDAGLDEEKILAHLPYNPIASLDEIAQAAAEKKKATESAPLSLTSTAPPDASPAAPRTASPAPAAPPDANPPPAGDLALPNLLEYIEQIQSLIAGAARPDVVCDRFLRALGGLLPFDEMAVYLADPAGGELVLAASLDPGSPGPRAPEARPCRLIKGDLGWAAFDQGQVLIQHDARIEAWRGEAWVGPGALALPLPLSLPLSPGDRVGVWLTRTSNPLAVAHLGGEPVRLMRLLAEMLGLRLRRLADRVPARPEEPSPSCPQWDEAALLDELRPELARAARQNAGVALLRLRIAGANVETAVPIDQLGATIRANLRLYDRLGAGAGGPGVWDVIAPLTPPEVARRVAERLLQAAQDAMDAHGGLEEQGLRVAVGVSIWGSDATTPETMIEHADRATALSPGGTVGDPIRVYDSEWVGPAEHAPEIAPGTDMAPVKLAAARPHPRRRRMQA